MTKAGWPCGAASPLLLTIIIIITVIIMLVIIVIIIVIIILVIIYFSIKQHTLLDSLRGSSVDIGAIQRRLAWPLPKDDTHKSRSVK